VALSRSPAKKVVELSGFAAEYKLTGGGVSADTNSTDIQGVFEKLNSISDLFSKKSSLFENFFQIMRKKTARFPSIRSEGEMHGSPQAL
jgi:hypothetical protein